MKPPVMLLASFFVAACLVGCKAKVDPETEKAFLTPVVPEGFDEKLLDKLTCLENGSQLRFANRREIAQINDRIGSFKLKTWGGEPQRDHVAAVLIRADGKIGYRVENNLPVLKIEEALVLDERVGSPNPQQNRK